MVSLTGTVATSAESHLARRIAEQTRGVQAVVNGLKVDPSLVPEAGSRSAPPDDAELKRRINEPLADDTNVQAGDIDVHVEDGRVTLSGTVSDAFHKHRAERITRSLYGVEGVQNDIRWTTQ